MFLTPTDWHVLEAWRRAQRHRSLARILLFCGAILGIAAGTMAIVAGVKLRSLSGAEDCCDLALYAISGIFWLVSVDCFVSTAVLRLDSRRYAVVAKLLASLGDERTTESNGRGSIE